MALIRKTPSVVVSSNGWCPGCGHGIASRLVAEVLEEMGLDKKAILVEAVGCSCLMGNVFDTDMIQASHGRAPATATAIKRLRPDCIVFTYQGDGDLGSIGLAEITHAAARNENFTTIFINNGVFGMTGGQMAPTSLVGQRTSTSMKGRDPEFTGMPLKITKMLATLPVEYIARGSLHSLQEINKTKKYIRTAFENQVNEKGFSFVEILSPCPTNWHMSPQRALKRIEEEVVQYYELGEVVKKGEILNV